MLHYKRSKAFKSEVDIVVETNPYGRRSIVNTELLLELNLKLMEFLVRLSKNEKITEQEIKELTALIKKKLISEHMEKRSFSNDIDLNFLRKVLKQ